MLNPRTVIITITALTLILGVSVSSAADAKDHPGYMDLEWIEIPDGASEVRDIDLSTILISIAANAKENGSVEMAEALSMIESIRVKSFSLTADDDKKAQKNVDKIAAKLKSGQWNRLIHVKDKDETVTVSTKNDKSGKMVGMMLVVYEPGNEVTFANIVGDLDIVTLFKLVSLMDSGELEGFMGELDIEMN